MKREYFTRLTSLLMTLIMLIAILPGETMSASDTETTVTVSAPNELYGVLTEAPQYDIYNITIDNKNKTFDSVGLSFTVPSGVTVNLTVVNNDAKPSSGTITVDGILALKNGGKSFKPAGGSIIIGPQGSLVIDSGAKPELKCSVINYGAIINNGADFKLSGPVTNYGAIVNNGKLTFKSAVVSSGTITNNNGATLDIQSSLDNNGVFDNGKGATLTLSKKSASKLSNNDEINNAGTISFTADSTLLVNGVDAVFNNFLGADNGTVNGGGKKGIINNFGEFNNSTGFSNSFTNGKGTVFNNFASTGSFTGSTPVNSWTYIGALVHDTHNFPAKADDTVAPTCCEEGYDLYICTVCGATDKSNFKPVNPLNHKDSNGDAYETYEAEITATCISAGSMGVFCEGCDAELSSVGLPIDPDHHAGDTYKQVITPATGTAEGLMGVYCSDCYELLYTEEIAAIPDLPDHLIINQAYGNGKNADGSVSHSFVEIYNPTDGDVDLSGWSLQYAENGASWAKLDLSGVIQPNHSYLVRANGGRTVNTRYEIYYADQEWPIIVSNDSFKFALVSNQVQLSIGNPDGAEGVVDLVGAFNAPAIPLDYGEGGAPKGGMSKQKAVRRAGFADTDNNSADFEIIDYRSPDKDHPNYNSSGISDERLLEVRPRSLRDGGWTMGDTSPLPEAPGEASIRFGSPAGLYESQFDLELTIMGDPGAAAGYTIRYTLNGDDPSAASAVYDGAITIRDRSNDPNVMAAYPNTEPGSSYIPADGDVFKGTVVKAQIYTEGGVPVSDVYTNSYFVNGGIFSRYGNLPIISIAVPADYFFDPAIGIYVVGNGPGYNWDNGWERPANVEMFDPVADYSQVISQGMGIRIQGAGSRGMAQKSLRLYARNGLVDNLPLHNGKSAVDYDVFLGEAKDSDGNALTGGFKRLLLRSASNDSPYSLIRDLITTEISMPFSHDKQAYRPAVAFVNGEFWGLYEIHERLDEQFIAQHYGADNNSYETLEDPSTLYYDYQGQNWGGMREDRNGSEDAIAHYLQTVSYLDDFIVANGINTPATYNEFMKYVDEDSLIDYAIIGTFKADNDWVQKARPDGDYIPGQSSFGKHQIIWRYTGAPKNISGQDGKYRFMLWDGDFAFFGGPTGGPETEYEKNRANAGVQGMSYDSISLVAEWNPENFYFFGKLMQNDTFRRKFVNRYMDKLNTSFKLENLHGAVDSIASLVAPAMPEQKLRWSITPNIGSTGDMNAWSGLVPVMGTWWGEVNRIKANMALRASRDPAVSGVAKGLDKYAGTNARATLTLKASAHGSLQLNGMDIAAGGDWSGLYYEGFEQAVKATADPGYKFSHFVVDGDEGDPILGSDYIFEMPAGGATVEAVFTDASATGETPLVINQIYGSGPLDNTGAVSHGFIELYNTTDAAVSLAGWSLQLQNGNESSGILATEWEKLDFGGGDTVAPHGYFLIRLAEAALSARCVLDRSDVDWIDGRVFSNRAYSAALVSNQTLLMKVITPAEMDGVVDLVGALNDGRTADEPINYEGAPLEGISKQKSARRIDFRDTDNNAADFEPLDYRSSGISDEGLALKGPHYSGGLAFGNDIPVGADAIEFSRPAGLYDSPFDLTLSTPSGYTIYYTLDGEDPDPASSSSAVYGGVIPIYDRTSENEVLSRIPGTLGLPDHELSLGTYVPPAHGANFKGTVVKARLFDAAGSPVSQMYINSYFVNEDIATRFGGLPVISISTPAENLFNPSTGIYMYPNFFESGADWERPVFFEMFEADGARVVDQGMGVRMHGGDWNRGDPQKSLRFYARSGSLVNGLPITNGKSNVSYDLFQGRAFDGQGNPLTSGFTRFLLSMSGNDLAGVYNIYLGALMRDALTNMISGDYFNYDTMAFSPAVAFINGEFWGFYQLRQRYDDEYLALKYGGDKNNYAIIEIPTLWGGELGQGVEEDLQHYLDTAHWAWGLNVSQNENYELLKTVVDEDSMIDYVIMETFIANRDWAASHSNNQRIWRYAGEPDPSVPEHDGRYREMICDTDESFGGGADPRYPWPILTTDNQDILAKLLGNGRENLVFFTKLWENQQFRDKFINRYMDVLNTCLQDDVTVGVVDGMEASMDSVMQHDQQTRWNYSLSYEGWKQNVANIKTWLRGRASQNPAIGVIPVMLAKHTKNTNIAPLTLINQDSLGHIVLNGMALETGYPGVSNQLLWIGKYFTGYTQTLTAVANSGETFTGFQILDHTNGASTFTTDQTIQLVMSAGGYTVTALYGGEVEDMIIAVAGDPIYTAAYAGEIDSLPEISVLYLSGKIEPAEVEWDIAAFLAANAFDLIDLTGTVAGTELTVTAKLEIIPRGLIYFIDSGMKMETSQLERTSSPAYDVISEKLGETGISLYNEIFDKFYDAEAGGGASRWGVVPETVYSSFINGAEGSPELDGRSPADKLVSNFYGWNPFQVLDENNPTFYNPDAPLYVEYRVYLPKGEYLITTGHYLFCDRRDIVDEWFPDGHYGIMDVAFNDVVVQDPFILQHQGDFGVWTHAYTQEADGELVIRFYTVDGDGAIVSFIGVAAKAESPTVTVTFADWDGAELAVQEVSYGGTAEEPDTPTREGYIFLGWFTENAGEAFDFSIAIHGDVTLTAKWEEIAAREDAPELTVAQKTAYDEDTVFVPVSLSKNPGLYGLELYVGYDNSQMTLIGYETGDIFTIITGPQFISNNPAKFVMENSIVSLTEENGTILTLQFKININAKTEVTPISLSGAFAYTVDEILPCIVADGGVEILECIKGDVNHDGLVNIFDVMLLRQYIADWKVSVCANAADLTNDGNINLFDVLAIRQMIAGAEFGVTGSSAGNGITGIAAAISAFDAFDAFDAFGEFDIASDGGLEIYADNIEYNDGEYIDVVLDIESNPGLFGSQLYVNYDRDLLETVSIQNSGLFPILTTNDMADNPLMLMFEVSDLGVNNEKTGKLVTIRFKGKGHGGGSSVLINKESSLAVDLTEAVVPISVAYVDKAEHVYGKAIYTEPVCEADGFWTQACGLCGDSYDVADEGSALGHDLSTVSVAATCEMDGYTTVTCSRCGYKETTVLPKLGHDWGAWFVTKPAAYDEDGEETRICGNDGSHTETKPIPNLSHEFGGGVYTEPSCDVDGYWTYTCELCGDSYTVTDEGSALGHSYVGVITTPATCDSEGLATYACSVCRDAYTGVITKLDHIEGDGIITKSAGCEEDGEITYYCSVCGVMLRHESIHATGHSWGAWTATKAVAGKESEETRTCLNDANHIETRSAYYVATQNSHSMLSDDSGYSSASTQSIPAPAPLITINDTQTALGVWRLNPFADVSEGDWYYNAVTYVYANDLMYGTSVGATLFSPEAILTRAMTAAILYRQAGEPEIGDLPNAFNDVADDAWYVETVKWAAANGIMFGYDNGKFGPEDAVTKEQLAAIICRLLDTAGYPLAEDDDIREYADLDNASDWAKPAVKKAAMQGIFKDIPSDAINPHSSANRAEFASMFYHYLTIIGD